MCEKHLSASECGVSKPHGHCECEPTAHFGDMLRDYAKLSLTRSQPLNNKRDMSNAEIAKLMDEKEAEEAAFDESTHLPENTYGNISKQVDDFYSLQTEKELEEAYNDFDFILADHVLKSQARSELPTITEESSVELAQAMPSATGEPTTAPTKAHEEERAAGQNVAAVDFNVPQEDVPSKSEENKESLTTAKPKTEEMFVFLNLPVGDENLSLRDKASNWWKKRSLFTRIDTSTLVNLPSDHVFPEHIDVQRTSNEEVKRVWRRARDTGQIIQQRPANLSVFRKLLPACLEVTVYSDLLRAAVLDSRLRSASVIVGGDKPQISRALDPMVTKKVEELRLMLPGKYENTTLLTWTCIAVMNQLTAQAVFRTLATTSKELDFRTWGQSRTKRWSRPPTSLARKRSTKKVC